jgi:hypothetical protein
MIDRRLLLPDPLRIAGALVSKPRAASGASPDRFERTVRSVSSSALLDREGAAPAMAVMHDDTGGAMRAGELVRRELGVRAARVHRRGLVVIGSADDPDASATGHYMHAPLVI